MIHCAAPANKVLRDQMGHPALQERMVFPEKDPVLQALRGLMPNSMIKFSLYLHSAHVRLLQALLAHLAHPVTMVCLELLGKMELMDYPALLDHKDLQDHLDNPVKLDSVDLPVKMDNLSLENVLRQARLDHQGVQGLLDNRDDLERQERMVKMAPLDQWENLVNEVLKGLLGHQESQAALDRRAHQEAATIAQFQDLLPDIETNET